MHGGHGAGSYDFETSQNSLLMHRLRVITMDQRGVLRSPPLAGNEALSPKTLVNDMEEVRRDAGIERWSLIGHSFGGYLAALYGSIYPERVNCIVLENAALDLAASAREILLAAAMEYFASHQRKDAHACLEARSMKDPRVIWDEMAELLQGLGEKREKIYVHGVDQDYFRKLAKASGLPDECWKRGADHQRSLFVEGSVFSSLLESDDAIPDLPMLIAKGRYDHVMGSDQIYSILRARPGTRVEVFNRSAHFPHFEEPYRFSEKVVDFVTGPAMDW